MKEKVKVDFSLTIDHHKDFHIETLKFKRFLNYAIPKHMNSIGIAAEVFKTNDPELVYCFVLLGVGKVFDRLEKTGHVDLKRRESEKDGNDEFQF